MFASSGGGYLNKGNVNTGSCVIIFNIADNTAHITWLNRTFLLLIQKRKVSWIYKIYRQGHSVITLYVDQPVSYISRIGEFTFLVGNYYRTERIWKVPGDCLTKCAA